MSSKVNLGIDVDQDKLAGFVVSLGGIGCYRINDIGHTKNCEFNEDLEYGIWDFRTKDTVGLWSPFGVISDMEKFVICGLKPLLTKKE